MRGADVTVSRRKVNMNVRKLQVLFDVMQFGIRNDVTHGTKCRICRSVKLYSWLARISELPSPSKNGGVVS